MTTQYTVTTPIIVVLQTPQSAVVMKPAVQTIILSVMMDFAMQVDRNVMAVFPQ